MKIVKSNYKYYVFVGVAFLLAGFVLTSTASSAKALDLSYTISGMVFNDANGDGIKDSGENGQDNFLGLFGFRW